MATKKRFWLAAAAGLLTTHIASAENFAQVYQDALKNDPTFKQAQATWLSTKQNLPIALANLLPTLDITSGVSRNFSKTKVVGPTGYYNNNNYGANITEQVFNYGNWMGISGAKSEVKSATATYLSSLQSLMQRTASAYLNVLIAASTLRYTIALKNAYWQQYVQSEQKYKVGLIAITPVYDAQAQYDIQVANEITDRNAVDNALEDLRAITGKLYSNLSSLGDKQVPLYIPNPRNIDNWTEIALKQNWSLVADKYTLMFDRRTIQQTAAGRYPTVNATASWGKNNYSSNGPNMGKNNNASSAIGLSMDFPIYQGGLITAQTKQKEYDYLNDSATLLFDHRDVVSQTRQAYLGIIAGISGVKADRQSVISNENSLKATKAGYAVGTRTMVDLLLAMSSLYSAQKTYAVDQYTYIKSLITLKQQAGTLSEKDINRINTWLIQKLPLIKTKFNNSYTPSQPSSNIKLQGQPMDIEPTTTNALPSDGPRSGDMPRTSNKVIGKKKSSTTPIAKDHYAVQLFASDNKSSAHAFIVANQLNSKAHILSSHDANAASAYKVVTGDYKTFHQANQARKQLSASLKRMHPWVTHISAKQHVKLKSYQPTSVKTKQAATKKIAAIKLASTATQAKPNKAAELNLPKPESA